MICTILLNETMAQDLFFEILRNSSSRQLLVQNIGGRPPPKFIGPSFGRCHQRWSRLPPRDGFGIASVHCFPHRGPPAGPAALRCNGCAGCAGCNGNNSPEDCLRQSSSLLSLQSLQMLLKPRGHMDTVSPRSQSLLSVPLAALCATRCSWYSYTGRPFHQQLRMMTCPNNAQKHATFKQRIEQQ